MDTPLFAVQPHKMLAIVRIPERRLRTDLRLGVNTIRIIYLFPTFHLQILRYAQIVRHERPCAEEAIPLLRREVSALESDICRAVNPVDTAGLLMTPKRAC